MLDFDINAHLKDFGFSGLEEQGNQHKFTANDIKSEILKNAKINILEHFQRLK